MLLLEDKLQKFLDNLFIQDDFSAEEDSDYIIGMDDVIDTFERSYPNYDYASGASKFVIWDDKSDYVIKVPFLGETFVIREVWDEDADDYVELDEYEYDFEEWSQNFCDIEYNTYLDAVAAGLDFLFAKTWIAGRSSNNKVIYAQEKVHHFGYRFFDNDGEEKSCSKDSKEKASKMMSNRNYTRLDDLWLGAVIDFYGEEVANDFLDFVDEHEINDLHCGNVGFRNNGEPILIDFSGWF